MSDHTAGLEAWFREQIADSEVEVDLDRVFPVGPDLDQPDEGALLQSMTAYFVRVRLSEASQHGAAELGVHVPARMERDRTLGGRLGSGTARVEQADWDADSAGRLTFRVIITEH